MTHHHERRLVELQCIGTIECLEEARRTYKEMMRFNSALAGDVEPDRMGKRLAQLEWAARVNRMRLDDVTAQPVSKEASRDLLAESAQLYRWLRYYSDFGRIVSDCLRLDPSSGPRLIAAAEARKAGDLVSMGERLDICVASTLGSPDEGAGQSTLVNIYEDSQRWSAALELDEAA